MLDLIEDEVRLGSNTEAYSKGAEKGSGGVGREGAGE